VGDNLNKFPMNAAKEAKVSTTAYGFSQFAEATQSPYFVFQSMELDR